MNNELERLHSVGQAEYQNHIESAERLRDLADNLITQAEWHARQADKWTTYLGTLATNQTLDLPLQRERPDLKLIEGGLA